MEKQSLFLNPEHPFWIYYFYIFAGVIATLLGLGVFG